MVAEWYIYIECRFRGHIVIISVLRSSVCWLRDYTTVSSLQALIQLTEKNKDKCNNNLRVIGGENKIMCIKNLVEKFINY